MKFDFVVGNPPFHRESVGQNANDTPVYHYFYDEAFKIGEKVELITPARYLFKAGGTPSQWNKERLQDEHFKILFYEENSRKVFAGKEIKGGIAVGYRDSSKDFGEINIFIPSPQLRNIKDKVAKSIKDTGDLTSIISNRGIYKYSKKAYDKYPDELTKTADSRIAPSSFERMPELFLDSIPSDNEKYVKLYGRTDKKRVSKYFRSDLIKETNNLKFYKVLVPKAMGNGVFGEILTKPFIAQPNEGFTETYISIGQCRTYHEALNILKYIQTKFARTMLGILKVTQNNAKPTWKMVPMQDFTENSDIDWTKSISEIDQQLYKKYKLSNEEIDFIEEKVQAME